MDITVYRLLRRALRAYQLYPTSSPVRLEAATSLHSALEGSLRLSADGVSFVFLEDGAYIDGRQVESLSPEEAPAGAGADLFHLGVREIRFLDGLSAAELDRLLDPLSRALQGLLNPVDEDLSVLLWEANLPHVWYLLYEDAGDAEQDECDPVDLPHGPILQEYLDPRAGSGEIDMGRWACRLSDEERLRVVAAYLREWDQDVPRKYVRLLVEVVRAEGRSDECAVLRRMLENQLETEAAAGRFALLREALEELEPRRAPTPAAAWALEETTSWFTSPAFLKSLLEVRPAHREDAQVLPDLIGCFPAATLPEGLAACLERPEGVSPEAAGAIRARFETDAELLSACLRDSRPSLRLAACERIAPRGDDLRRVREMLRDRDPAVRRIAVLALGRSPEPGVAGLLDALFDADASVRVAAAEVAGRRGGREGLDLLLRLMASNGFDEREERERCAVYRAAGLLAPREVWPILARLAERRRGAWFSRKTAARDPAIEALAGLGEEVVRMAHERWSRRPDLRALLSRLAGLRTPEPAPEESATEEAA